MAEQTLSFVDCLTSRFPTVRVSVAQPRGEITLDVPVVEWCAVCKGLRDEFDFEQLSDLCGVDYLGYGNAGVGHHWCIRAGVQPWRCW